MFRNAPLPPSCPAPPFSATHAYRLRNVQRGGGTSLDVTSFHPSGNFSGQSWTIAPTGGGCFRLTNAFTGSGQSLDVTDMHPTGNASGQSAVDRHALLSEPLGWCTSRPEPRAAKFRATLWFALRRRSEKR